jgi:hypothetical protein
MPTVSLLYDIFSLIQRYANIQVDYKSTVHGILEIHSNCPWCPGSKDSFIMEPETGRYSHKIRTAGCGRTGDCIDFLKEYMNMSHTESCEVLGLEDNADFVPSSPSQQVINAKEQPPLARWQETGLLLVERAVRALWNTSEGRIMLDYLHGRGLKDEIIKKKRLGYVPLQKDGRYLESSFEIWGLDPDQMTEVDKAKGCVRVPNGILIPWIEGDSTLWRLAIKRPGEKQSYGQVMGSGEGLYNVSSIQWDAPAMITEGELCALSVEQEAGDLVSCVATGSATRARLNRWVSELSCDPSCVLQSFDDDESGDLGADYWLEIRKCMRWSPLVAKDPNDILQRKFYPEYTNPCSLREWVEAGLSLACVEFGQEVRV